MSQQTVVVGMSGGVDSSVTALLLKQQGYHVIGMFMKNWEEKDSDGVCKSAKEFEDVVRVCEQLDIPYYSVNFVKDYWEEVFSNFLAAFHQGRTPNPDILCNREIKFKVLLNKAMEIGGDFLATGHYCQNFVRAGANHLVKGADPGKDQTYFLYTLGQEVLKKVLFPVGGLLKSQLRAIASEHGLATSAKKDSTGICFIGKRNFKEFLSQYIAYTPGNFESLDGRIVGTHDGVVYYTLGQRKGMGIGGEGDAWFVVGKDVERNVVHIAQGSQHPALYSDELKAVEASWISGKPPALPFQCSAKVRYRQPEQACVIEHDDAGVLQVRFLVPQRAVTPGQSVVFYDGDACLGGAIIDSVGPSYYVQKRPLPATIGT